jgi:hypothetical protein
LSGVQEPKLKEIMLSMIQNVSAIVEKELFAQVWSTVLVLFLETFGNRR